MNRLIYFFALLLVLSCESNDCQESIRKTETIAIIETLITEKGLDLVSDFPNKEQLPICLNLYKVIVDAKCFEEVKHSDKIEIIKISKPSFLNQGEVCIEQLCSPKPDFNHFFQVNDSLNLVNQNECFKNFNIPKSITKDFKTIQYSKEKTTAESYIQFSIPIFSKDNKKAFLKYDHHSSENNSFGSILYLEKINAKWKIVYSLGVWNACK